MKTPGGDMEGEDDGGLLPAQQQQQPASQLDEGSPDDKKKQKRLAGGDVFSAASGSWMPTWILLGVVALLYITIWTLPAPTFFGKLGLLHQSWRINAVLDESEQLRGRLGEVQKTREQLEQELSTQEARSKDLQRRLDASGGETKSLRQQVADEQVMVSGLESSNSLLDADFQKQKERRLDLLHKLQRVKTAELHELDELKGLELPADAQESTSSAQAQATDVTTTSLSTNR